MGIYLRAKHWQLFIVLVGSMILAQAIMFNSIMSGGQPDIFSLLIPMLLVGIVFFGWLVAVASACHKALPTELSSSPKPMQVALFYAFLYMAFGFTYFALNPGNVSGFIVIPHLLAMASIFYSLGFTAKQLAKLEHGKDVAFFTYSGPLFLFWFFPVGVWFLQPKINQLLGEKNA